MANLYDLTVTPLAIRKHSRRGGSRGDFTALFTATRDTDGATGHVLFEYEWEKRDAILIELSTDNPALFDKIEEGPDVWIDIHAADFGPEPDKHPAYEKCTHTVYEME